MRFNAKRHQFFSEPIGVGIGIGVDFLIVLCKPYAMRRVKTQPNVPEGTL